MQTQCWPHLLTVILLEVEVAFIDKLVLVDSKPLILGQLEQLFELLPHLIRGSLQFAGSLVELDSRFHDVESQT